MNGVDLCSMSPRALELRNQRNESRSVQPVHFPDQPKGILRQTSDVPNKPKTIEQLAKLTVNVVCGKTNEPEIKKPEPPKAEKKVGPTHGVAFGKTIPVLNQKNNVIVFIFCILFTIFFRQPLKQRVQQLFMILIKLQLQEKWKL